MALDKLSDVIQTVLCNVSLGALCNCRAQLTKVQPVDLLQFTSCSVEVVFTVEQHAYIVLGCILARAAN